MNNRNATASYRVIADGGGNRYCFYCDVSGIAICTTRPVQTGSADKDLLTAWENEGKRLFNLCRKCGKWISQQTGSEGGYARPTYEEIRDKFGCDAAKTHPDSWESDYHVYRWETSGGADFLVLSFKVAADGTETWNSSSWSQGLKD